MKNKKSKELNHATSKLSCSYNWCCVKKLDFGWVILLMAFSILLLPSVIAYSPHKQNTELTFSITSNNASSCNTTTVDTPSNFYILNMPMTKNGIDFYITLDENNFTDLGDVCININCFDGINSAGGSKCVEVTPSGRNSSSNIVFIIFLIIIVYAIALISFFGKNEVMSLLTGMFLIALSIYLIREGVIIYRDWITNYFSYLTLAIGTYFSITAAISLME